jgi:serine/threonine protein kinase
MSFSAGENVGSYRIIEKLGQGGMATVFKAYHPSLDRYVAIKVLHPAFKEDPQFLERFTREARVVARLEHPNIVQVYDFAEHDGQPYLVMKFIEGETLKARLQKGPLTKAEATKAIRAIGESLSYAHGRGVLHRDVKPSNILISKEGQVYLTDFGLARMAEAGASTLTGDMLMGTPQYISPEQARGEKDLNERTDIYSFGIVLYEIVVGRVPFSADTPFSIIHDHIYTPLPLPREVNPKIPLAIQEVLLTALAKEPEDRYASGEKLVEAFFDALNKPDAEVAVEGELEDTKTVHKEIVAPIIASEAKSDIHDQTVAVESAAVSEDKSRSRKTGDRKWVWIAAGLIMTCLAVFSIMAAINQSGVRNQTENSDPTSSEVDSISDGVPSSAIEQAILEVEQRSNDPDAHLMLADAYLQEEMHGESAEEYFEAGMLFLEQERLEDAIKAMNESIVVQGGIKEADAEKIEKLVEVLFVFAPDRKLTPMYTHSKAQFPNWEFLSVCQARNMLHNGDRDQAQGIIDEVLRRNPSNYLAKTVMAEINFMMGQHQEALDTVKELQTNPSLPDWLEGFLDQFQRDIRSNME